MIYLLVYIGGPKDGEEVLSPRPYCWTEDAEGNHYEENEDFEWLPAGENTTKIRLYYRGKVK